MDRRDRRGLIHWGSSAGRTRAAVAFGFVMIAARAPQERLHRSNLRLFQMLNFGDVLGGMGELERDRLAMSAGRKAPALDYRHLMRYAQCSGRRAHCGLLWK